MKNGGMGDLFLSFLIENNLLKNKTIKNLSVNLFPKCGTHQEVLKYHGIDYKSLAKKIIQFK